MFFNAEQELHIHNNVAYFNDITRYYAMQYKYRYMNSLHSVCYRIRITFVRSNTSSKATSQLVTRSSGHTVMSSHGQLGT